MIPFIPVCLDSDGVVTMLADSTAATGHVGPQGYAGGSAIGTTDEVSAVDGINGGVAYSSSREVRLHDATSELPAGAVTIGGFAVTKEGALCYTTDAPDSSSVRIGGVAVTSDGRVHVSITT